MTYQADAHTLHAARATFTYAITRALRGLLGCFRRVLLHEHSTCVRSREGAPCATRAVHSSRYRSESIMHYASRYILDHAAPRFLIVLPRRLIEHIN